MKLVIAKTLGLAALSYLGTAQAFAQAPSNDSLNQRLEELDQKIRVLERLHELQQEDAKAAAAKAPKVLAGEGGLGVSSADGAYVLKVRGFVQPQAVYFLGNVGPTGAPAVNNFSIKRLHSDIQGNVGKQIEYRAHVNFASGAVDVQDAYIDWKIKPEFAFRVGKFKPPTGLERLLSYSRAPFIEASFVPALQPNRDLGIQVFGDIEKGLLEYQLGYFAGARDGLNNTGDNNDAKDVYARVFSHPLVKTGNPWLTGLGVGVSGSYGEQLQTTGALPAYGTGRQGFFSYHANDTTDGDVIRISPQAYYYAGPLGVIAEYTQTTQPVRRGAFEEDLTNSAWAVTASWFVTGDKNAYKGIKIQKANTFPSLESFGALEVLARATGLKVDDAAFAPIAGVPANTLAANPATSARGALGLGLGTKWYLNNAFNILVAYEHTLFDGGAGTVAAPTDRDDEQVVSTAFNLTF